MPVALEAIELLTLTGPDAVTFANAQFTTDIALLAPGHWQWSAWLDEKGRARAVFAVLRVEPDALIAWLPLGGAEAVRAGLARYVFRAKVTLAIDGSKWLHAAPDLPAEAGTAGTQVRNWQGGWTFTLPGWPPRTAWIGPADGAAIDAARRDAWRRTDIELGLPLLPPDRAGGFVPQALDLEHWGAIAFDKGCYPGQEIAARLHFRGGNKLALRRLQCRGESPPASGSAIIGGDGARGGTVLYAAPDGHGTSECVAVLPLEFDDRRTLQDAAGAPVVIVPFVRTPAA
ncbi:MAG: folate-binding protein [Lysobacterales bacterium]